MRDYENRADAMAFIEAASLEMLVSSFQGTGRLPTGEDVENVIGVASMLHSELERLGESMQREYTERLVETIEAKP